MINPSSQHSSNKKLKPSNKDYPLQGINYQQMPEDKKILMKKILYLFVYYASKGSRHGYYQLPEHYFMELMEQIWSSTGRKLQKKQGIWLDLQILYYSKGCRNSLNFKNFLQMLPTLAMYVEPDLSREDSLKNLMHGLMEVYQHKVAPQIEGKYVGIELIVEENTREFLTKLSADLTKLYKLYFQHEINAKCKQKYFKGLSLESFIEFLKDFEVYPKIISARDVFYIFNQGCDSSPSELIYDLQDSRSVFIDQGKVFRLSKFVQALINISRRVFPKLKQIQNQQQWENQQKYILRTFLQYMQTTKTTSKKKTKCANERFCFIVLDEHPEQEMVKTIQVDGKIRRELASDMNFFTMMSRIKF